MEAFYDFVDDTQSNENPNKKKVLYEEIKI